MPIFTQGNNSCYFIHIPRTGGRYISSLFENSHNIQCKYHKIQEERIQNIDVTHLHYPLYEYYFGVNQIPHITVVRNPFDKFSSSLKNMHEIHNIEYENFFNSYENFLEFINVEIEIQSFHNNWFLPQYKFFSPKTKYWKYEWGFGDNFEQWIYKHTGIVLNASDVNYQKFLGESDKSNYKLSNKTKGFVKRYYKKDYRKFRYFL